MFKKSVLLIATSSLVVSACTTTLKVHKIEPGEPNKRDGIVYFLPFNQFKVSVTWSAKCDSNNVFGIAVNTIAKKSFKKDPTAAYLIDYQSLDSALKTSSVSAEFHEETGLLKSVNAAAADEAGSTITSVATALGKAAMIGVGDGRGSPREYCSTQLKADLDAVENATGHLKVATNSLKKANEALKRLQAQIIKAGGSIDPATLADLNGLIADVRSAKLSQEIRQAALNDAKKKVSHSVTIMFPEDGNQQLSKDVYNLAAKLPKKWAVSKNPDETFSAISDTRANDISKSLGVRLKLQSAWFGDTDKSGSQTIFVDDRKEDAGIRYRLSVPASLITCVGVIEKSSQICPTEKSPKALSIEVMQGSTTYYLPFKSESFTSAKLSATFSRNGVLTSAGYVQSASAAKVAAESAANVSETILGIAPAKRARRLAALKERAELISAENELSALIEARSLADPDEIAVENAEAEEAEAEASSIEIEANIILRAVSELKSGEQ